MNMGDLVPIMVQDVIPGDSWQLKQECLMRMMPMLAPIYHNINVYIHYFFVPNRIIWDEWEDFITGGKNGTANPVFPRFEIAQGAALSNKQYVLSTGSLADYMGFPVKNMQIDPDFKIGPSHAFSQLPFRAYQTIYNEYYRDQNLEDEIVISKASGTNAFDYNPALNIWDTQASILRKRAWEKDYFTSALPWTQRGTQMSLPITGDAPVKAGYKVTPSTVTGLQLGSVATENLRYILPSTAANAATGAPLYADLSDITTTTINELRQAFQIQKWMERSARSGSRYTEVLQSFFGVSPRDSRLQRPEFLGGGKMPLSISEVLQTSETSTTPLGEFAGHGITYGSTARFRKFFTEHGFIIGIMSVLPRTAYCQGLPKVFQKFDKYDYFWKEFAHLGEQEIKNSEIYFDVEPGDKSNKTFGYTARYNEYRYIPDTIHGQMLTTLSYWHLGRMFQTLPVLNNNFIKADPSTRIFPVQDNSHKLIVQTYAQVRAIRPVPKYGDPLGI
nr:MAG: major capsid protein [Microvirus sp.]